jgi:adenylate kinase
MSRLYFFGGAHGVGKSTLCRQIALELNARHVTASELIASTGATPATRDKRVASVTDNQTRMLSALSTIRDVTERIVLDGHFCIRNVAGESSPVGNSVVRLLDPAAIVLVEALPEVMMERLNARDGIGYTRTEIEEMIACESSAAQSASAELKLPLHRTRSEESPARLIGVLTFA